uniref:BEN domain-containing protein n=1 Tax=Daphnia galeata TaxID=27404 RepID=A0A8J2WCS4_9CRUS|nr:unnamed protein product [Daphnia galeata]
MIEDKQVIENIHTAYIDKRKPQAEPAVTNSYRSNSKGGKSQPEGSKMLSNKNIYVASKTSVQDNLLYSSATNQSKRDYNKENSDDDLGVTPISPEPETDLSRHSPESSNSSDFENNELMQRIKENQALIEEESQDMNENGYTQRDFVSKETFEEAKKDLLETIRGLKKEISDSELNFEHERDQFNKELSKRDVIIAERDNEILVLKQSNPNVIVQDLKEGLICLKSIIETAASLPSRTVRVSTISESPSSNQLTKLDEDCDTMISKDVLKTAIFYGKCGTESKFLAKMEPPKPALPADPVLAITNAVVNFWFNFDKAQLPRASVRAAISTKLLHEHTAKLKSEIDDEAGIAEDGNDQDAE